MYALEREIEVVGKLLRGLLAERKQVDRARARCHNTLLLIHRLPDEVLSSIFSQLGPASLKSPLLRVCHLWRQIYTLHTPVAWTDLFISWQRGKSVDKKLAIWLERSRAMSINFGLGLEQFVNPTARALFELKTKIQPAIARCQELYLSLRDRAVAPHLFPLAISTSTRKVEIRSSATNRLNPNPIRLFESDSFALTDFIILCPSSNQFEIGTHARWSSLVKLDVTNGLSIRETLQILTQCMALEYLSLEMSYGPTPMATTPASHQFIALPSLTFLSLTCSTTHQILPMIIAPKLNKLIVSDLEGIHEDLADILLTGPHPVLTFPLLHTLKIALKRINASQLVSFVRQFPELVELSVSSCEGMDQGLRDLRLALIAWPDPICAGLRKLEVLSPKDSGSSIYMALDAYLRGDDHGHLHHAFRIALEDENRVIAWSLNCRDLAKRYPGRVIWLGTI